MLIAAYALYAAAVLLCLRMIQINTEAHPKMPEKVPVHFGLSGEPDRWMKKGTFTKYFMPVTCLSTVVLMFFCFTVAVARVEGEVWPEFSAVGGLLALATAYLMYGVNIATVRVALGQEETIWKFMKLPLLLFVVGIVMMVVLPFLMPDTPELSEAVLCSSLEKGNPVDEKTVFSTEDGRIYLWTKWKWLNRGEARAEWYEPGGGLFFEYKSRYSRNHIRRIRTFRSYIGPSREKGELKRGAWKVKVFHDDKLMLEKEFEIR